MVCWLEQEVLGSRHDLAPVSSLCPPSGKWVPGEKLGIKSGEGELAAPEQNHVAQGPPPNARSQANYKSEGIQRVESKDKKMLTYLALYPS